MDKDTFLVQSNILTTARYDFTKVEKRAVYFIINEVRKQFIETPRGQRNIFDNLIVKMTTESLQKSDSNLQDIYKALKSLRRKSITYEDDNRYFEVGYINYSDHQKGKGIVEVEVSKLILPHLVELAEQYTSYSLMIAISLRTKYTQRFYELCSQWRSTGFLTLKIDDLRVMFMIEDKYNRYALVKKNVIDVAQKELKECFDKGECDLYFTYKEEKKGSSVNGLKIVIITKENQPSEIKLDDAVYLIRTWLNSWFETKIKPKNKVWVEKVIKHIQLNADLIPKLHTRLLKLQQEENIKSLPATARHIIEEDYMPE
jgi:plasmid replication initiation protein